VVPFLSWMSCGHPTPTTWQASGGGPPPQTSTLIGTTSETCLPPQLARAEPRHASLGDGQGRCGYHVEIRSIRDFWHSRLLTMPMKIEAMVTGRRHRVVTVTSAEAPPSRDLRPPFGCRMRRLPSSVRGRPATPRAFPVWLGTVEAAGRCLGPAASGATGRRREHVTDVTVRLHDGTAWWHF
jgi:hypothetical protein